MFSKVAAAACFGCAFAVLLFCLGYAAHTSSVPGQTIYIRNVAQQFISDKTIERDLPAWQKAVDGDFAQVWHTTQYRLVFIGSKPAPKGSLSAVFVTRGPVKGALAYHTVTDGAPQIVVYAGTDDYFGFSNSVSFTHELFELAADPTTSITNQGWPYDWIWIQDPQTINRLQQVEGTVWINEVCDPVESYSFELDGVKISDFVTPNWFNDETEGDFDFMHLVQQPFTILKGGYASFWDGFQWQSITNFKHAGRDADGFLIADKEH